MIKKTELNYIAGIFDGEGSIWIYKRKENNKIRINTSITNTNLEVLEFVKETMQIGNVFKNRDDRANLPCHGWQTTDGYSYIFLKRLLPYLKIKRVQAENAIKQYEENNWRKIKKFQELH